MLHAVDLVAWSGGLLLVVGLALRLGPRDGWGSVWAIPFYATPLGIHVAGGALASIWASLRRQPRRALAWGLFAWVMTGWLLATHWRWEPRSSAPADLSLVYWNIARPQADSSGRVAAALRDLGVDLLCLAEVNPLRKRREAPFVETVEPQLPGYRRLASTAHIGLWVGARIGSQLEIVSSRREYLKVAWGFDLDLRWRGRPLRVLVVDFDSAPSTTRTRAMGPLREWVERQTAPWLVIGDFNTPLDSVCFDAWRAEGRHAFERAGRGYMASWPLYPAPVLAIDHAFTSGLTPLRVDLLSDLISDHRALRLELAFSPPKAP
ncbi:MAG TPA: hypothetical protein DEA08_17120 [Planctomycetes bacterium]|nr:hypothetical protein [Planctomycetota bacterium]